MDQLAGGDVTATQGDTQSFLVALVEVLRHHRHLRVGQVQSVQLSLQQRAACG